MNMPKSSLCARLLAFVALVAASHVQAALVNYLTFDDSENLLAASVGSNAVSFVNAATAQEGPGNLSAVPAESPILATAKGGAIAIPPRSFLAIPNNVRGSHWCLSMRFYLPASGSWYSLLSLDQANTNDAWLFVKNDSAGGFGGSTGGWPKNGGTAVYTPTSLGGDLFGRWNDLVLCVDSDESCTLYVNGERLCTSTKFADYDLVNNDYLYIGADNSGEDTLFYVDSIRIYNETAPSEAFVDYDALAVTASVVSHTENSASISANVTELGTGSMPAELVVDASTDESFPAPFRTLDLEVSIATLIPTEFEFDDLTSDTLWYFRARLTSPTGLCVTSEVCSVRIEPPKDYSRSTVYRPGLVQAKFEGKAAVFNNQNGVPILVSNLLNQTSYERAKDVSGTKDLDFTYGGFMGHNGAETSNTSFLNPWSGVSWNWSTEYSVFAYEGEVYLHEGDEIVAAGRFDDGSAAVVDGTSLFTMNASGYNDNPRILSSYTAAADGWYPINAWVWDWTGGKNICGSFLSGLQYNLSGTRTDFTDATVWSKLDDPGNGSFLRTRTKETGFLWVGQVSRSEEGVAIELQFDNVPHAATLKAYYGDADGETYPERWAHSTDVATIAAGYTGMASYVIPGAASSTKLRFCLCYVDPDADGTAAPQSFWNWSQMVQLNSTPDVSAFSVAPGYTNAVFSCKVKSIGAGVSSATMKISVAYDENFRDLAREDYTQTLTSDFEGQVTLPLDLTNTAYYAVLSVDNGIESSRSETISFTTLEPTAGVGNISVKSISHDSVSCSVTLTAYGDDSNFARVTLQVSPTEDFAEVVAVSDMETFSGPDWLDMPLDMRASGLQAGSVYYARVEIVNAWGFVSYSNVASFSVDHAAVLAGIAYSYDDDGLLNATVVVSELYASPATLKLYRGTALVGQQTITQAGEYAFTGLRGGAVSLRAEVIVDGDTAVASIDAQPGTSCLAAAVSAFSTPRTALVAKVGDRIQLPPRFGLAHYLILCDERFLTIEENIMTARAAGIAAVEDYNADGELLASGIVLIKPADTPASSRVFVYDDTVKGAWSSADTWRLVGAEENSAVPSQETDLAFIPLVSDADCTITVDGSYSVQDLFVSRAVRTARTLRLQGSSETGSVLSVLGVPGRKGRRPGKLMFSSNTAAENMFVVNLGGSSAAQALHLAVTENTEFDFGGPTGTVYGPSTLNNWVRIFIAKGSATIQEGKKLSFVNGNNRTKGGFTDQQGDCQRLAFDTADYFRGSGTVELACATIATDWGHVFRSFSGEFVNSVRGKVVNYSTNRGGPYFSCNYDSSNSVMRLSGFVGANFSELTSVGIFVQGNSHGYGAPDTMQCNGLPDKGVVLEGGVMKFNGFNKSKEGFWLREDGDYEVHNFTDKLTIGAGLSFIDNNGYSKDDRPINHLCANSVDHSDFGTLYVLDRNTKYNESSRTKTVLKGIQDFYAGYAGEEDSANDVFPVIPWFVVRVEDNNEAIWWGRVNEDGTMVRGGSRNGIMLQNVNDPNRNVFSYGNGIELNADKTINAFYLGNGDRGKLLGADKTLTITSGGLILAGQKSAIGTPDGGDANGNLSFPNTAYVYATSPNAQNPNQIWAKVSAPNGFVLGFNGYFVLGGDQTGIDGHLTINNGTTYLGSLDGTQGCRIDAPVRLVGGNTKLVVTKADDNTLKNIEIETFTTGGYSPKIELPAGTVEACLRLSVDGVMLRRGTYGATGSGADNINDDLFTGTGVLKVRKDAQGGFGVIVR